MLCIKRGVDMKDISVAERQSELIKVVEPIRVSTRNSVYFVEPYVATGEQRYKVRKVEDLHPCKANVVPIDWSIDCKGALSLGIGKRCHFGPLHISRVLGVEYTEPHH